MKHMYTFRRSKVHLTNNLVFGITYMLKPAFRSKPFSQPDSNTLKRMMLL